MSGSRVSLAMVFVLGGLAIGASCRNNRAATSQQGNAADAAAP